MWTEGIVGICWSTFAYEMRNGNPDYCCVRQFNSDIGLAAGRFLFGLEDPIVVV